jgi:hypothetical protein
MGWKEHPIEWDVQLDDDFAAWLAGLEADLRNEIVTHANLLREHLWQFD